VLRSGEDKLPSSTRSEPLAAQLDRIRALAQECKGNLVRVHEELAREGVRVPYSTLTGLCRRHRIAQPAPTLVGALHFAPGQEMQHDTSPHRVEIGGALRTMQCASLVLCHSRMLFAQVFPVWNRFRCKVFLTEALRYMDGAARRCMLDNSSVIIGEGTGSHARAAPEMEAFARRFGFEFVAHAVGDAKRSGRVERPFHYIENNFYAGRTFATIDDVNAQLRAWCDSKNALVREHLKAAPVTLYALERPSLQPLPVHIPAVERLFTRIVDQEGFINLHTNRYSVPIDLLGRELDVHEGPDYVRVFKARREVCTHARIEEGAGARAMLAGHHDGARWHRHVERPRSEQESQLRANGEVFGRWIDAARARGRTDMRLVLRVHRLWTELPREALEHAFSVALEHGLFDVNRVETIALRAVKERFFLLPSREETDIDHEFNGGSSE
jgi:transposase